MIARLPFPKRFDAPSIDPAKFATESDVEQKFIYPFLTNPNYLNIPSEWVKTKEYMSPTEIDKTAGKRLGYYPDYSVWISGVPVCILEAKSPDNTNEYGIREARLYATEINKRYPPNVNPIKYIISCNGHDILISEWDSEETNLSFNIRECAPGSTILDVFKNSVGRMAL